MFKVLNSGFLRDPRLEMKIEEPTENVVLFGKTYRMYADDWKKHIHLKCTNRCDANCAFCIERASRSDREDPEAFMRSMRLVVEKMKDQEMFRTLSVTGGEPTLFPRLQEIIDFSNEVKPMLFSINSNGAQMLGLRPRSLHGWLNLSKHTVEDMKAFGRQWYVGRHSMLKFKEMQPNAKLRIQAVLGVKNGLEDIPQIFRFIDIYRGVADDFSFRSLIIESDHGKMSTLFREFRDRLFDEGCIVEQAIQDYYVYETYEREGVRITLSWANMFLLQQYNEENPGNFLEEIIVHPDGMITGSWNRKTLIIKEGGR